MKTNSPNSIKMTGPLLLLALMAMVWCQGCDNQSGGTAQQDLHLVFVANSPDDFWPDRKSVV